MRQKLFTLLFAIVASTSMSLGDELIDGWWYDLDWENHTARFFGCWRGVGCSETTNLVIPSHVSYRDTRFSPDPVTFAVTSIGYPACNNWNNLVSVSLPNTIEIIEWSAFAGCINLKSINIPTSVTSIDSAAFAGCNSLTSITLPNSVTNIGAYAFSGCSSLASVTIGNSVTSIGNDAFKDCIRLTSIEIPNSVTTIGKSAFSGCSSLTSVTIGNSVTSIGGSAFFGCSSLTSIEIPNSVTSIENNAFRDCSSLTSITIPNSVTSIGGGAFYDSPIETIYYIGTIEDWCSKQWSISKTSHYSYTDYTSYYENSISYTLYIGGVKIDDLIIPDNVTTIRGDAFSYCSSLRSVKISASITNISDSTFSYCVNLDSINIPDNITNIGNYAFRGCDHLKSVVIGKNVRNIGYNAFANCNSLLYVICQAVIPPTMGIGGYSVLERWDHNVFDHVDCAKIPLYVPSESIDTYRVTDQWKEFNYMLSIEEMYYIIRFLNWDDSILQYSPLIEGDMPIYSGLIPTREDEQYYYRFSGWSPEIEAASKDVDYIAQYTAIKKVTVEDLALAGYDIDNNVVLCCYFDDEPCNNVYFVGTPNNWGRGTDGGLKFSNCVQFQPLEGFDGWYVVEFPYSDEVQGKPVQAPNDGSFSWNFQCGDPGAWKNRGLEGTNEAYISYNGSITNESDVYYPSSGCYIYEIEYWKNHKTPCVPKHNYTIQLYTPNICPEMKPAIIGDFNNWSEGVAMTEGTDNNERTVYTYILNSEAGLGLKFREASIQNWTNELQYYDETTNLWCGFSNHILPEVSQDSTLVFDYSDNTKYKFKLCDNSEEETYYTIRFVNWDGEVLQNSQVHKDDMPIYYGTTPTRPSDEQYNYLFSGWHPALVAAIADITYTAQYMEREKSSESIIVRLDPNSCSNWNSVYLYSWINNGAVQPCGGWPGTQVTRDADGWWSYTFDSSIENVNIIWNNGQGAQTVDIVNVSESTCYALDDTYEVGMYGNSLRNVNVVNCPTNETDPGENYHHVRIGNLYYDLDVENGTAKVVGVVKDTISVTDHSLADWDQLPEDYVFEAVCPEDADLLGLKSVKVYADQTYIYVLVEPNMDDITDLSYVPFDVIIDTDNSDATDGYVHIFTDDNADILTEGALFADDAPYNYNPAVYKWWGEAGDASWGWIEGAVMHSDEDCYGALICEGSLPIGQSQYVNGKFEIRLNRELIPATWNSSEFGIGFGILQSWNYVGVLPLGVPTDENWGGYTNKLKVLVDYVEKDNIVIPAYVAYKNRTYNVDGIGSNAFAGCSLQTLTCEAVNPPVCENDAFGDMDKSVCSLYVPAQSIDLYRTADQWEDFFTILPIEDSTTTVFDTISGDSSLVTRKVIIDGQILILRGDKVYTVTGQEVR